MKWVAIFLQLLSFRKNWLDSQSMVEAGQAMAEKSKRLAILLVGLFFGAIFLVAGVVIASIELGLQIEAAASLRFSGLFVSSLVLAGLGLAIVGFAYWGSSPENAPTKSRAPEQPDRVKDLVEECLVVFLTHLKGKN